MKVSQLITRLGLVLVLLCAPLSAQVPLTTQNDQGAILTVISDESITIAGTPIGFTTSKIAPTCAGCAPGSSRAQLAVCVSDAQAGINFRFRSTTGGTVDASTGQLFASGTIFSMYGYTNLSTARFIRTASTSVVMYCIYYKFGAGPGQ